MSTKQESKTAEKKEQLYGDPNYLQEILARGTNECPYLCSEFCSNKGRLFCEFDEDRGTPEGGFCGHFCPLKISQRELQGKIIYYLKRVSIKQELSQESAV